jgi:hypothetical protein
VFAERATILSSVDRDYHPSAVVWLLESIVLKNLALMTIRVGGQRVPRRARIGDSLAVSDWCGDRAYARAALAPVPGLETVLAASKWWFLGYERRIGSPTRFDRTSRLLGTGELSGTGFPDDYSYEGTSQWRQE